VHREDTRMHRSASTVYVSELKMRTKKKINLNSAFTVAEDGFKKLVSRCNAKPRAFHSHHFQAILISRSPCIDHNWLLPIWVRRIRLKIYSLRSELKRIWLLFAWYSLILYFSHTSFIHFIRLYSLKNIRFHSLQNIHLEALPTVYFALLPTVYCPLFPPTVFWPVPLAGHR
jgi:hypothetical protein